MKILADFQICISAPLKEQLWIALDSARFIFIFMRKTLSLDRKDEVSGLQGIYN